MIPPQPGISTFFSICNVLGYSSADMLQLRYCGLLWIINSWSYVKTRVGYHWFFLFLSWKFAKFFLSVFAWRFLMFSSSERAKTEWFFTFPGNVPARWSCFIQLSCEVSITYWSGSLLQLFSCYVFLEVMQDKPLNCTCIKSCRNRKRDLADNYIQLYICKVIINSSCYMNSAQIYNLNVLWKRASVININL